METIAVGFWGGYFGTVALMLAGSVFAYVRGLRRVATNAAISAVASALFVLAYLRWLGEAMGSFMLNESRRLSVCICRALRCASPMPSVKLTPMTGTGVPSICAAKLPQPGRVGVMKLPSAGAVQMLLTEVLSPQVASRICGYGLPLWS